MRSFLPMALLFIAFTVPSIAQKAETATPAPAEVVVREGAPLTVECSLRVEQPAQWQVDGGAPAPDLRAAGERPGGAGRLRARLRAPAARRAHAGLYTCAPGAAAVRVRVLPDDAAAETSPAPERSGSDDVVEDSRLLVMFDLYHPYKFNCSLEGTSVSQYQWFANETELHATPDGQPGPKLEEGGAVLLVPRMREDDWGNYTCRVAGGVMRAWRAHARPIARVPSDTNVVEGQKFSITCKLIGKPHPRVRWTYAEDEDSNRTEVGGARFSTKDSAAGVPGGVLEVSDAVGADAGLYYCEPPEGTVAHSTLRVKDVYAALWPFLGICLEVFILCAIILVYEKRRTKPEMEDSDADTHDQKKA